MNGISWSTNSIHESLLWWCLIMSEVMIAFCVICFCVNLQCKRSWVESWVELSWKCFIMCILKSSKDPLHYRAHMRRCVSEVTPTGNLYTASVWIFECNHTTLKIYFCSIYPYLDFRSHRAHQRWAHLPPSESRRRRRRKRTGRSFPKRTKRRPRVCAGWMFVSSESCGVLVCASTTALC